MKSFGKFSAILPLLAAFSFVLPAAASTKGEKTLGVGGGVATYNNSGLGALYFQYTFSQHLRISPELAYVFSNDNKSAFSFSADVHFPFRVARAFNLYPLAGVSFNSWDFKGHCHNNRGAIDLGGGLDLYLTSSLKLTLQGKYALMKDYGGAFVQLGIGYVF